MNKEEILCRSRAVKQDEGVEFIERQGLANAFLATDIFCALLVVAMFLQKFLTGEMLVNYRAFVIPIFMGLTVRSFTTYYYTREKQSLFYGVLSGILLLLTGIRLFL